MVGTWRRPHLGKIWPRSPFSGHLFHNFTSITIHSFTTPITKSPLHLILFLGGGVGEALAAASLQVLQVAVDSLPRHERLPDRDTLQKTLVEQGVFLEGAQETRTLTCGHDRRSQAWVSQRRAAVRWPVMAWRPYDHTHRRIQGVLGANTSRSVGKRRKFAYLTHEIYATFGKVWR